jgi:hypothetical protein
MEEHLVSLISLNAFSENDSRDKEPDSLSERSSKELWDILDLISVNLQLAQKKILSNRAKARDVHDLQKLYICPTIYLLSIMND